MRNVNHLDVLLPVLMNPEAHLVCSTSAGKDSDALVRTLSRLHREQGWNCHLSAVHADLTGPEQRADGLSMEWPESLPHCEDVARECGMPLAIVTRQSGGLLTEFEQRRDKLAGTGKPFWSSPENRFCTSDQKRGVIDTHLRAPFWSSPANRYCTGHQKTNPIHKLLRSSSLVISAEGICAHESKERAKKTPMTVRTDITTQPYKQWVTEVAKRGKYKGQPVRKERGLPVEEALAKWRPGVGRLAFTWYPLFDWSLEDVWVANGTSSADLGRRQRLFRRAEWLAGQGYQAQEALVHTEAFDGWPCHPQYVRGNERLSCAACILGSPNDLRNAVRYAPDLVMHLVKMEQATGCSFQHKKSLESYVQEVNPALLTTRP